MRGRVLRLGFVAHHAHGVVDWAGGSACRFGQLSARLHHGDVCLLLRQTQRSLGIRLPPLLVLLVLVLVLLPLVLMSHLVHLVHLVHLRLIRSTVTGYMYSPGC